MYFLASNNSLKLKFTLRNPIACVNRKSSKKTEILSEVKADAFQASTGDVVAEFATVREGLACIGRILPDQHSSTILSPATQTYRNLVGLFVRQLRSITQDSSKLSVHSDIRRAIEQVRSSFETSLGPRTLTQNGRSSGWSNSTTQTSDDMVDIFEEDFEHAAKATGFNSFVGNIRSRSENPVFQQQLGDTPVKFRVFDQKTTDPMFISGFLSLEIGQIRQVSDNSSATAALKPADMIAELHRSFKLLSQPIIHHDESKLIVGAHFSINPDILQKCELFFHWGRYADSTPWVNEEVSVRDAISTGEQTFYVQKQVYPVKAGDYGLTFFARPLKSTERVWGGRFGLPDAQFSISSNQLVRELPQPHMPITEELMFRGSLQQALGSYEHFLQNIYQLSRSFRPSDVQKGLYDITKEQSELQVILSQYYARARRECANYSGLLRKKRDVALGVLDSIGLGEIVFIAPEGHHAIAGGLAQMIVGLTETLARKGLGATLITTLYEEDQGNKHKSADALLNDGIFLLGERVKPELVGQVNIPFGPMLRTDNGAVTVPPENAVGLVYLAQTENIRVFFLRHRQYANKLYPSEWADQQLRKAIFLSRGALEIVRDPRFRIRPSVLVTNDWMAGLAQVYRNVDQRYSSDPLFQNLASVHIIHNCGKDYQGRIPAYQFGEQLFPIMGIGGEHYMGLADPHEPGYVNLTRGAIFHTSGAIVAVSKPYAEQLLTPEAGEGLDDIFRAKKQILVGVSNGIDVEAIRQVFFRIGEDAREALGETTSRIRPTASRFLQKIVGNKKVVKRHIQRKYGLEEREDSVLLSMIGRLTEQKGIQLLTSDVYGVPLLEHVLQRHPSAQIIIGGPANVGDPIADKLRSLIDSLSINYPGRIKGIVDFIKHRDAIAITFASDLFLMPSRFEPGGITQLEALAAGTPVVARNVGGIAATLSDYNEESGKGDSFLFFDYNSYALAQAIERAVRTIGDEEKRLELVISAAHAEHDWTFRLGKYVSLFQHVVGALSPQRRFRFLFDKSSLVNSIRP